MEEKEKQLVPSFERVVQVESNKEIIMKSKKEKQSLRKLQKDQKGLSTMEYAVLFVVIVVGALVAWSQLGADMATKVQTGTDSFNTELDEAQGRAQ